MKYRAFMGIGIPGSGKSGYLKNYAHSIGATYISSDETRGEITGDEGDVSKDDEVWPLIYTRVHEALDKGHLVLDATNSNGVKRRHMVDHILEKANGVTGMYFDLPLNLALERNRVRERVVPTEIIEAMYQQLQDDPPMDDEGFQYIILMHSPIPDF